VKKYDILERNNNGSYWKFLQFQARAARFHFVSLSRYFTS